MTKHVVKWKWTVRGEWVNEEEEFDTSSDAWSFRFDLIHEFNVPKIHIVIGTKKVAPAV
jgi:hypothetical protein